MSRSRILFVVLSVYVALGSTRSSEAQLPIELKPAEAVPDREVLHNHFQETLANVKLVGRFTVLGKEDGPLSKEEYTIRSVTKLPQDDYWLFNTRIKYGQKDVSVPLPLEVKWAGDTPIITLTNFTIPGMGTFGARVVIHNGKYAGTWTHGEAGGHLFGVIGKLPAEEQVDPVPKP